MADYLITWVDYAQDQYLALDQNVSSQLDERLRRLALHPQAEADYDATSDHWTAEFDAGRGLVLYIVNDDHRRLVILRVLHLG